MVNSACAMADPGPQSFTLRPSHSEPVASRMLSLMRIVNGIQCDLVLVDLDGADDAVLDDDTGWASISSRLGSAGRPGSQSGCKRPAGHQRRMANGDAGQLALDLDAPTGDQQAVEREAAACRRR